MPETPVHVQVLIPNTYFYPYSKYTPGSKITPVPLYTPRKSRLLFYTPGGLYTGFYGIRHGEFRPLLHFPCHSYHTLVEALVTLLHHGHQCQGSSQRGVGGAAPPPPHSEKVPPPTHFPIFVFFHAIQRKCSRKSLLDGS